MPKPSALQSLHNKPLLMVLCFISFSIIILKEAIIAEVIWKYLIKTMSIFLNNDPF